MMDGTPIEIERITVDDGEVVEVRGELDLSNARLLEDSLSEVESQMVILDLTNVEFIDSAGIRTVDRGRRSFAEVGRTLLIVAPPASRAASIFRIAGFGDRFLLDSRDGARSKQPEG